MALGSVSIPPFTRAELVRLINQKSYPDGKLVYTTRGLSATKAARS